MCEFFLELGLEITFWFIEIRRYWCMVSDNGVGIWYQIMVFDYDFRQWCLSKRVKKIWVDMNEMVFTVNIYLVVKIASSRSTSWFLYSVNLTLSVTAKVIETIDIKIDDTERLVVIF
ncbi:hypothetical protein LOTGIDRAFT_239595 [Lottia gigantea]|uniref:Uncharacterized protein n=1 Tax=Lottia gigantea TaxID=225164 RepID=V4AF19_LOTGI|nr:hypothetical protein LOTGIDRAFT_239595 [Lottia gigantea]ESO91921.1 hypothetical protein LOTGIDRAFT_239595 [Lottia gigantea]